MRENILDEETSEDLRFYVVWLNQRSTDARDEIDESTLADPRVTQYWDGRASPARTSRSPISAGSASPGSSMTSTTCSGPDATWADAPSPLAGSGGPVLYQGEELLAALRAQL